MLPATFHYDALVQLFQTPGYVVLLKEMIHEVRIVPLDGRPHLGPTIGQWMGDSRGRWEGHTLVIETTNFSDKTNYAGLGFGNSNQRTRLLEVGHVGAVGDGFTAHLADGVHHLAGGAARAAAAVELGPEVVHHHLRALARELECVLAPDAAPGAGDDHDPSFADTTHAFLPIARLQIRSMMVTLAWPPPSHIVCKP